MEREYSVYCHTFPNGKKYIGISSDCEKRWRNGKGYETQPKMDRAIKKYGWSNVKHDIVIDGLTHKQANELEKWLIAEFDCIKNGYNSTIGGDNILTTYLCSDVMKILKNSKRYSFYEILEEAGYIEFVENGKADKPLGELCNEAYRAIQLKRQMNGQRPFSITSEDGLCDIWNEMIYFFQLNTAIILGDPLPEQVRYIL